MKSAVGSVKNNTLSLLFSDFKEITKAKLAISVVFSSIAGYFLGADQVNFVSLLLLMFGGYCMVGASNAYNQIIEKDLDSLMKRTRNRPIPSGRMSVKSALIIE
ncbi:MAG: UbiA family prenyltransferase, partial [Bacteroidota bacterium]|nr:UbiA family prenyltransferase [Bacteroidota bacterium]